MVKPKQLLSLMIKNPKLNISRQEILNMIGQWVSEGSGWAIDRIDSHFINVTLYKPVNGVWNCQQNLATQRKD